MCHKTVSAAIAAALLLFWDAPAWSQNNAIVPSITLDTRFDSNARFKDSKTTNDESDFIGSVEPRFEFSREQARYDLRGFYSLNADYHTKNPELNNLSHAANLKLNTGAGRLWSFGAGDSISYSEDSLRAIGTGILVTRTDILANTAYVSASRQVTRNTDLNLTLRDHVQKFDDPALIDSRTDTGIITGRYRYSTSGRARMEYSFTNYNFNNDGGKDIESHMVKAGFEQALEPDTNVDIGAGVAYTRGLDGGGDTFLTANLTVDKSFTDSVMTLAYERDITNPTGLTDEISIRDTLTFVWDHTLKRDLFASFYAGLAKNRTEPDHRVDINSYIAEVSGNWRPRRWVIIGAGLSHYQQWPGDNLGIGLTRNKVFLNVTFIGGEWRF